ncbi:hypothetical protein Tco_1382998, partial [Tanacetum coccineum]
GVVFIEYGKGSIWRIEKFNMAYWDDLAWAPRIKYSRIFLSNLGYGVLGFWIRRIEILVKLGLDMLYLHVGYGVLVFSLRGIRAKSGLKRKQFSKHTFESNTEASKSKTSQSEKETQSSSAKDKSPSHPLPPTLVVGEMHKEAHQAAGGPTSLRATSKEGAHPQLSTGINPSVLVDQTKSARDGLKTAHTDSGTNEESRADEISKKIKLEDLSDLLKDTRSAFFTPDSLQDKPIIVSDENEEEEAEKDDTHATSHDVPDDTSIPHPPSLKSAQI